MHGGVQNTIARKRNGVVGRWRVLLTCTNKQDLKKMSHYIYKYGN